MKDTFYHIEHTYPTHLTILLTACQSYSAGPNAKAASILVLW